MTKKLIAAVAVLALLTAFTVPAFAQGSSESSVRGNLAGTVVDSSGAVVTGAKVSITGPTGTKSDTTNQDGQFLFPLLSPGYYSLKVEKGSFKTADVKGVEVVTGKTSNVRVGMVAGQQTEVVEVVGNAVTIDTTSTAVAANLTDTFYQSVPVARGVTGLFYASPGVTSGGGTGTANPSVSGGTGLENNYIADGVNITDGGFGGIGVYSRNYGSLGTGLNLSFVKEVQVKTGGFEAQYGRSTGGIVQIVTKSGGNDFHGSIGGYFAPQNFEGTRKQPDDFQTGTPDERFNLQGKILHQSNYDAVAEVGGHVPGFKDKLFFFGSFNPQWNTDHDQWAQLRGSANCPGATVGPCTGDSQPALGNIDIAQHVYSYDAKLTWKLNQNNQFESSVFGDPTYGEQAPNGVAAGALVSASPTGNDKLQFGTRSFVVRYNGVMTPTWLVNASFSWGHNNLSDKPFAPNDYGITDISQNLSCGAPQFNPNCDTTSSQARGLYFREGLGYYENTQGDNYGWNIDTSKTFRFLGEHNVTLGYNFARSHYDGTKLRSGPTIPISAAEAATLTPIASLQDALVANGTNATFQLRASASQCGIAEIYVPGIESGGLLNTCGDGGLGVRLRQTRGEFGNLFFKTTGNYHTLYAQDAWSLNKYVTINAGLRWEQQQVKGTTLSYTFTDNWSPRLGITIDPWGNRKTKIFANFGRYTESLPLDVAIRSLSNELDFPTSNWSVPNDGAGHALINPDGTIDMSTFSFANNYLTELGGISAQSTTGFAPGTRSEYLDEYVVGFEHEFGNSGVIFTARYTDRRIKRIVEDLAALSPEAFQNNFGYNQNYLIGNPSKSLDIFVNPQEIAYASFAGTPAQCTAAGLACMNLVGPGNFAAGNGPYDSNGNPATVGGCTPGAAGCVDSFAVVNAFDAATGLVQSSAIAGHDGIADGFVNPVRIYKSMEFEVNKSFSKNWQLRANYRIAKLFGNYEGSYRNDNGQNDPNISSLFDFTQGQFNLLGGQFVPGVLNTDVRHLANGFVSYTFGNRFMKGLTLGTSTHFQTGTPISNLFAHPAYQNAGEVPVCADGDVTLKSCGGNPRGSLGRTQNWGSVDMHADYPIRLTERTKIRLAADLFNLTDMRTQLRVDQQFQRAAGSPNADFLKPTGVGPSAVTGNTNPGYQRPFYARFGVKFEF